jgi:hypothetical protein
VQVLLLAHDIGQRRRARSGTDGCCRKSVLHGPCADCLRQAEGLFGSSGRSRASEQRDIGLDHRLEAPIRRKQNGGVLVVALVGSAQENGYGDRKFLRCFLVAPRIGQPGCENGASQRCVVVIFTSVDLGLFETQASELDAFVDFARKVVSVDARPVCPSTRLAIVRPVFGCSIDGSEDFLRLVVAPQLKDSRSEPVEGPDVIVRIATIADGVVDFDRSAREGLGFLHARLLEHQLGKEVQHIPRVGVVLADCLQPAEERPADVDFAFRMPSLQDLGSARKERHVVDGGFIAGLLHQDVPRPRFHERVAKLGFGPDESSLGFAKLPARKC